MGYRVVDLTTSGGCCVTWNGESQRFESDWLLFCWRFGQKYSPLLTVVLDSSAFFFQSRPLFLWKRLFLESILLIFGLFWIFLRVANLTPSPSYIIFLFSKLFFTFAFYLLPFPFHFLFSLKLLPAFLSWLSHARQIYPHETFLHPLYTQHGVSAYSLEPTFLSLRIRTLTFAVLPQEWLVPNSLFFPTILNK